MTNDMVFHLTLKVSILQEHKLPVTHTKKQFLANSLHLFGPTVA